MSHGGIVGIIGVVLLPLGILVLPGVFSTISIILGILLIIYGIISLIGLGGDWSDSQYTFVNLCFWEAQAVPFVIVYFPTLWITGNTDLACFFGFTVLFCWASFEGMKPEVLRYVSYRQIVNVIRIVVLFVSVTASICGFNIPFIKNVYLNEAIVISLAFDKAYYVHKEQVALKIKRMEDRKPPTKSGIQNQS